MGNRAILIPKLIGDDVMISVDFIARLAAGETLLTASVACSVYSGTDPNPQAMVDGPAQISGSTVNQFIDGGILGTVYELLYTVTTSLGQVLEIAGYYVVDPDLP